MEAALKDYYTPEELETKFKMADLDNNGHLDFTEFHKERIKKCSWFEYICIFLVY